MELWIAFIVRPDETIIGRGVPKQIAYRTKSAVLAGLKGHYGRIVEESDERIVFQTFSRGDMEDIPSDSFIVVERQEMACQTQWHLLSHHCT